MCDVYPGNGGGTRPTCSVISQLLVTCSSSYPLSLVLDAKKGSPTASSDRYENPLWKCLQSFQRDQFQTWRESKRTWIEASGNWSGEINSAKASTGIKIRQCRPRSKGNRPGEKCVGINKRKICEEDNEFQRHLKKCQEWVWQRDIQFSIRNLKTGLQIFDLFTTWWRSFKKKNLRFCIPTCYERWFRIHTTMAFRWKKKDRMNVSERFINRLIQRPNSDAYISTIGSRRFISHKNLMTSRYLVEDTMFLRVEVCPRTWTQFWDTEMLD